MDKIIILVSLTLVVLVTGAIYIDKQNNKNRTHSSSDTAKISPNYNLPTPVEELRIIPVEEIKLHNKAEDCWIFYDNKVYDITSHIPTHKGGNEVLAACGGDGSNLFAQDNLNNENNPSSHELMTKDELTNLLIGNLKIQS